DLKTTLETAKIGAKATEGLQALGYDMKQLGLAGEVAETAAHILTGTGDHIGLSEDEQVAWLDHYLSAVEKKHGAEGALKILTEAIDRFNPQREMYAKRISETAGGAAPAPAVGAQPEEHRA